jgi:hypothetical protein
VRIVISGRAISRSIDLPRSTSEFAFAASRPSLTKLDAGVNFGPTPASRWAAYRPSGPAAERELTISVPIEQRKHCRHSHTSVNACAARHPAGGW